MKLFLVLSTILYIKQDSNSSQGMLVQISLDHSLKDPRHKDKVERK